ncbi:23S rRNA (pseudouridine(1915)-N(3))-methyltransferase RlmH [Candidatus Falkowbacteria bacterium]|nr:23S rRNA (pseudouridine(1915)-N(3))-methyltransferase RlmH [Candidatus Falkowbacteria bacterium]
MSITLITVGTLKESWLKESVAEFKKRLSLSCKLTITELEEVKAGDDVEKIRTQESQKIIKAIPKDAYVIVLDETGKSLSSQGFSEFIGTRIDEGKHLVYIIGGSYGLTGDVLLRAHMTLSMSKMTFTHQMVRLFLLEQLYRAFQILGGGKYHK